MIEYKKDLIKRNNELCKILNKQDKQALIAWIIKETEWNEDLYNQIILDFGLNEDKTGEEECREIIRAHVEAATHKNFIDYAHVDQAAEGGRKILFEAERAFQRKEMQKAFIMARIALEELIPVIEYTDTDGGFEMSIHSAFDLLKKICGATLPQDVRHRYLKDIKQMTKAPEYSDWDTEFSELIDILTP